MAAIEPVDDVSRETLEAFAKLLMRWTSRINLVGSADDFELWDRHIMDCTRLIDLIPPGRRRYLDIGTGAGLPGLVIAILRPDLEAILIEADRRKCAFLRAVRRELSLAISIHCSRIESVDPVAADVISARALAPLSQLLDLSVPHGRQETMYLFPKGARWEQEVLTAREKWSFDVKPVFPARGSAGPILQIKNVSEIT